MSKRDNLDIIQRFIAQIFFLFDLKASSFTLILASGAPVTTFNMKLFGSTQEVIDACKGVSIESVLHTRGIFSTMKMESK